MALRHSRALLLLLTTSTAMAHDISQDEALTLRREGTILPLEQLLEHALARYPGARLLEVELEREHGRYVYEIELVTREGVVRELALDAADAQVISDKEDD